MLETTQMPLIEKSNPLLDAWQTYRNAPANEHQGARDRFKLVQHRALQAIANYRAALADSEGLPLATDRYKAKIQMSTAWKMLEQLAGCDETTRVLRDRETRPWMRA